jgi:hypothetical protein
MAKQQIIKIIYTPDGGSRREWTIDLANPAWDLHKAAPKAAGFRGWVPFAEALENVDAEAWQAMIWVLRRRDETRLAFDAVAFPTGLLNEVDFAGQCPDCREWLSTDEDGDEDEHDCPALRVDEDDHTSEPGDQEGDGAGEA